MGKTAVIVNLFGDSKNVNERLMVDVERESEVQVVASIDDGYTRIANQLNETLANPPVKLSAREYQVIFAVIAKTYRWHKKTDWLSNSQLSELTGIDESNIGKIIGRLIKKKILLRTGRQTGINPVVSDWFDKEASETEISQKQLKNSTVEISQKRLTIQSKTTKKLVNSDPHIRKETISKDKRSLCAPCVDFDDVKLVFNETCVSLKSVKALSASRKAAIKARCKVLKTIDDWRAFFVYVEQSDFLCGRQGSWQAGFDWILKEANFLKIVEGNYENKTPNLGAERGRNLTVSEQISAAAALMRHVPRADDNEVF